MKSMRKSLHRKLHLTMAEKNWFGSHLSTSHGHCLRSTLSIVSMANMNQFTGFNSVTNYSLQNKQPTWKKREMRQH